MAEETTGRARRADEVKTQRRRRSDGTLAPEKRLPIPPEIEARLAAEGRMPRWVNDQNNRLHRFTVMDDYDKVEGVEPVPIGTDETGKPIMAHLLSKPQWMVEEDREKADARRRQVETALQTDPNAAAAAAGGTNPNPTERVKSGTYVAEGTKIRRGNQILE